MPLRSKLLQRHSTASYPRKMFPNDNQGIQKAFRHIPGMTSFPETFCSLKSYSNTPKSNRSFPAAMMPSRSISPFTGIFISTRKPSLTCVWVALNSA